MTVRVRKARRSSWLACGHYVLRAELIASNGHAWICISCAIAAISAAYDQPKETTP